MGKEFVPLELAVKLKELGFNEPCLGYYSTEQEFFGKFRLAITPGQLDLMAQAPLWQQAFDWLMEEHLLASWIYTSDLISYNYAILREGRYLNHKPNFKSYEEARQACLEKLIEIVSNTTSN